MRKTLPILLGCLLLLFSAWRITVAIGVSRQLDAERMVLKSITEYCQSFGVEDLDRASEEQRHRFLAAIDGLSAKEASPEFRRAFATWREAWRSAVESADAGGTPKHMRHRLQATKTDLFAVIAHHED